MKVLNINILVNELFLKDILLKVKVKIKNNSQLITTIELNFSKMLLHKKYKIY